MNYFMWSGLSHEPNFDIRHTRESCSSNLRNHHINYIVMRRTSYFIFLLIFYLNKKTVGVEYISLQNVISRSHFA